MSVSFSRRSSIRELLLVLEACWQFYYCEFSGVWLCSQYILLFKQVYIEHNSERFERKQKFAWNVKILMMINKCGSDLCWLFSFSCTKY